jgi:hypothetical protein
MRRLATILSAVVAVTSMGAIGASAQLSQPAGVSDVLATLSSTPAVHTAFTFDGDMLSAANGYLNDGRDRVGVLNSITVENYHYHEPAFYVPENLHTLDALYHTAGWKHLVDQNAGPKQNTTPTHSITDVWLRFEGGEIHNVTVLVRGPREMSVVEVNGVLRPLDIIHMSGLFGIPKIDPNAVMVPAPADK